MSRRGKSSLEKEKSRRSRLEWHLGFGQGKNALLLKKGFRTFRITKHQSQLAERVPNCRGPKNKQKTTSAEPWHEGEDLTGV